MIKILRKKERKMTETGTHDGYEVPQILHFF
jgi:hypothetical protein